VSVLIITFTHNKQFADYTSFFDAIKNNADQWWHYMDSTWIVATGHTSTDFATLLYPHMDQDDRLLVAKLSGDYQGWLPADAWDWLNSKLY
jgi:hypothetical protein